MAKGTSCVCVPGKINSASGPSWTPHRDFSISLSALQKRERQQTQEYKAETHPSVSLMRGLATPSVEE